MAQSTKQGVLGRLRHDTRGNTMAIIAATLIPVTGFIGSGVDMSRAYFVKTRLQQACDAGALAGRKSMSGSVLQQADKDEALRFFRYNFPNGTMDTAPLTVAAAAGTDKISINTDADGQLVMTASATMPNVMMTLFGLNSQTISVSCKAEEFYVNTDVMLVLDTTGSMNCLITDSTTCGQETEKTNSKMQNLRDVVKQFYANLRSAQVALEAKNLRMRIGWVPYSSTVNVGRLVYALNPNFINNPATFYNQSRAAYTGTTRPTTWFTGTGGSDWNGCIEERQTDNTISASTTSIPAGAYDLDVATIPNSTATRWNAHDPAQAQDTLWINSSGSTITNTSTTSFSGAYRPSDYSDGKLDRAGYSACPKPAVMLKSWASTGEFNTAVDSIVQGKGGTYHDIGMIWGTRMIANTGIFGSGNPDFYNSVKVKRTIVLVTDGTMSPNPDVYGAYSVERDGKRVYSSAVGNQSTYTAIHEKRFNLMCERAKTLKIDIWVVAILDSATAVSDSLKNCANSGQALKVSDTTALTNAFKAISDKVGNLRIGG